MGENYGTFGAVLLLTLVACATQASGQQLKTNRAVIVPSDVMLAVIASQPDSPLQFDMAEIVQYLDGESGEIYRLRNRGSKPIRAYSIALWTTTGGGDVVSENRVGGPAELLMPGQIVPPISGSVVYPDGKPAPGFRVFRYRNDNPTGLQGGTVSQADGTFLLKDLEPGISYTLCASKAEAGYLDPFFLPFGLSVAGQCHNVMLRLGVDPGKVQLRLSKKAGALAGRLIDARTRRPVVNAKVILYRPLKMERGRWILVDSKQATWTPSVEAQVDTTGSFTFSGLPDGAFLLRAEAPGYRTWFLWNQSAESLSQTVRITSGQTKAIVVALQLVRR